MINLWRLGKPVPCTNVVELIQVVLDHDDRLHNYQFVKKTCGQGVGANSLLIDYFKGLSVRELLEIDGETFCRTVPAEDNIVEFLNLKHLFALQAVLETYTGSTAGGKGQPCAVADVSYDNGEVIIDAEIDVDVVTDKIKACQACAGG